MDTPVLEEKEKSVPLLKSVEEVIKKASYNDGLAIGIKESIRALETRKKACFCVLAMNCDMKEYKELVEKLCLQCKIDLIRVQDKKTLGLWAGLNKKCNGFKKRAKHNCSCLVVKSVAADNEDAKAILRAFKQQSQKVLTLQGEEPVEKKGKKQKKGEKKKAGK